METTDMNKYYSTHRITDGKWELTIWIREDENFTHEGPQRPDLRNLIAENYHIDPLEMAKVVLNNVLHCERVEVHTFSGKGVYVER